MFIQIIHDIIYGESRHPGSTLFDFPSRFSSLDLFFLCVTHLSLCTFRVYYLGDSVLVEIYDKIV